MQEILRTNSLTQAVTLQTALQAAGIEAALRGEHALGIAGGGVSVVVLDDRATDRARAILLEIDSLPESRPTLNKPLAEIVREYQRRWVQQLWITIIAVVYIGAVVITAGISTSVRAALVIGGAVVLAVMGARNWRCPNCNRPFGRTLWQARCPNCRVSFTSHGGAAA